MHFLKNLKISYKLLLVIVIIASGFLLFGGFSFWVLGKVKVNGPVYRKIVTGKDLIADLLPPPEYIIESYLTTFKLEVEIDNSKMVEELSSYLLNDLKVAFFTRYEFWKKNQTFLTDDKRLEELILQKSYKTVTDFFTVVEMEYLPAIKDKNREKSSELLQGKLTALYTEHRQYIEEAVKITAKLNSTTEKNAAGFIGGWTFRLITSFVVTMLLSFGLFWLVLTQILSSLKATSRTMVEIADSNNLTKQVETVNKDEIGEMAGCFNRFVGTQHSIISRIVSNSSTLASAATELATISSQIASNSEVMTEKTGTVAAAVEEATANINSIATAAEQMSTSSMTVATAIEEMSVTNNEVAKNCQKELQISTDALRYVNAGTETLNKLGESAKSISNVVSIINDIADQTNLLALNATIEAASAGEAGRGFAVVANEVKELAKQTGQATQEIEKKITEIQTVTITTIQNIG
jgi:methyl-accepting chemotaxis protein